jgi:hypothetical protein
MWVLFLSSNEPIFKAQILTTKHFRIRFKIMRGRENKDAKEEEIKRKEKVKIEGRRVYVLNT